jgi:hypothetical protein
LSGATGGSGPAGESRHIDCRVLWLQQREAIFHGAVDHCHMNHGERCSVDCERDS